MRVCWHALLLALMAAGCGGSRMGRAADTSGEGDLSGSRWEAQWRACEEGNVDACIEAAAWFGGPPELWPDGARWGPEPDPQRATAALSRACADGREVACEWLLGRELGLGQHVTSVPAKDKLSQDCDLGDSLSCVLAGNATETVAPDRAAIYYRRACEAGSAEGCHQLAILHHNGRGMPRSKRKSRKYFEQACELEPKRCIQHDKLKKGR